MSLPKDKNLKNLDFIADLIDELGGLSAVAKICRIKPSSVFMWKKQGIPFSRVMYLKLAYPNLKAWNAVNNEF